MTIIIGAGISGLSVAYFLHQANKPYLLLESTNRVGGYLQSVQEGNYLFELAANSILADEEILNFLLELGLQEEILYPNTSSKKRYILKKGRYTALPSSPLSLLFNTFFSWKTKAKIFAELRNKTTTTENETVAQFFYRRFGQEIVDYAVNPFIMGIYGGNPANLLIEQTFPQLVAYEKNYGSVLKGFIKNKAGGRKLSLNFKNGMETLPKAMAKNLHIRLNTSVNKIERNVKNNSYEVITTTNEVFETKNIVIATPAFCTKNFMQHSFPDFANAVSKIYYPPMIAVHSIFKKSAIGMKLDGFGGLHPSVEKRFSAGAIWTSSVLLNRCPDDEVMLTSFIGGAMYETHTQHTDSQLLEKLTPELNELYQITAPPLVQKLTRWQQAIPQYDKNSLQAALEIEKLKPQNIYVCANWYQGISLADAIKKGKNLAQEL
jgi:oxygen-dependent protoporphyrinogen oxidase